MEFSKNFLKNEDVRNRIYNNGVKKSKEILNSIFDSMDTRTEFQSKDKFCYIHAFNFNERYITAKYSLERASDEDLLKEVLIIFEKNEKKIIIPNSTNKLNDTNIFWHNIIQLQYWIEEQYDVIFLPLEPNYRDPQIIKEHCDEKNNLWIGIISPFHMEGKIYIRYEMDLNVKEQKATIFSFNQNRIYL